MHANSVMLFREYILPHISAGSRVLEIGPDGSPSTYRRQTTEPITWVGADLASELSADRKRKWGGGSADDLLMPSEYAIPAPDSSFDVVLSGQVIEHVRRPWVWMRELARVCAPGGIVATVNPVSWPYHAAPIDCWRIYPDGMRALSEDAGLVVESSAWMSLEPRPRSWFPGPSHDQGRGPRGRALNRLKALIGWPLSVAFDTVTIARKPTSG